MKKLVITFLFCISSALLFSQSYFLPVSGGIKNINDSTDFYIVEMPAMDSLAIYRAVKRKLIRAFPDINNVLVVDHPGDFIRLNATQPGALGPSKSLFDFNYTLDIEIRDGRYRFYFWEYSMTAFNGNPVTLLVNTGKSSSWVKYMFQENGSLHNSFVHHYTDMVKWLNILAAIADVRVPYEKEEDKW